uniref:phosphoinositide 5-phosphatase n=1 Tax=Arcella intermedia TaxID=1963864 RepID=A0A6B2KYB1_9EUKA
MLVVSRISRLKTGTRYNARGVNDDGNVGNFVETEMILEAGGEVFSVVFVRGSVPIFWRQRLKGNFDIEIMRSAGATRPAFLRHMEELQSTYGEIFIINLLSDKDKELKITEIFKELVTNTEGLGGNYFHWDFHKQCGNSNFENTNKILQHKAILDKIDDFRFYWKGTKGVNQTQKGVLRINCLDCLDRTNVIMGVIGEVLLSLFLQKLTDGVEYSKLNPLVEGHKKLWANNGDALSQAYTGTGAIKSGFTRTGKRTFAGLLDDAAKSAMRTYNSLTDDKIQEAMDVVLGNTEDSYKEQILSKEELWILKQLNQVKHQFAETEKHKIFIGCWNASGRFPLLHLDDWLNKEKDHESVSLYVFGFQEIVQLSANSIISADETNLRYWATILQAWINKKRKTKVILANSIQLVGLAVLILIPEHNLPHFRNFTIEKKKTAAQGLAGNKGALCFRFDFKDTAVCCLCCHLPAGQANLMQRLQDFEEIVVNTVFPGCPRCPEVKDHDFVFCFGDLNFRVDFPVQEALNRIGCGEYEVLYANDQLNKLQLSPNFKHVIKQFKEGKINFAPTYKYFLGSEHYHHHSIKNPSKEINPSWCDRILYRAADGMNIKQLDYGRAELYISDHRPIYSIFEIDVEAVDQKKRNEMENQLYIDIQKFPKDSQGAFILPPITQNPESTIGYPKLPPKQETQTNKIQETVLNCKQSLQRIQDKLKEGQPDNVKPFVNLAAGVYKTIFTFLSKFPSNPPNISLAILLFTHTITLAPKPSETLTEEQILENLTKNLIFGISLLEEHIPKLK